MAENKAVSPMKMPIRPLRAIVPKWVNEGVWTPFKTRVVAHSIAATRSMRQRV